MPAAPLAIEKSPRPPATCRRYSRHPVHAPTPAHRTSWLLPAGAVVAAMLLALLGAGAARSASPGRAPALLSTSGSPRAAALLVQGLRSRRTHAAACGSQGLVCSQVSVPLDRTGQVPGTVSLHVEELPAQGTPRGVMFLIAGGPGQGSAHVFGLGDPVADALYRYLFPGYTLVAYDDRGTGASGLIDCPALQTAATAPAEQAAAAACGAALGSAASFYSTAVHAEDLDAVRQALGFDRVGLYGVSYGTKLSLAYALAHPANVDRLLLDSVLPPQLADSYGSNVLQSLTTTLQTLCTSSCNAGTLAADAVALANRYAAQPLRGSVLSPSGRAFTKTVDGLELLSVILDADLNPGLAAELPGALHAARVGNPQPLLRLSSLHDSGSTEPSVELSAGLYAATVCRDGPFPWQPDTAVADRPAILQAAIAALPPGTLGPFGPWAADFGNAGFCLGWPGPSGGAPLGSGPLPDVPMLAVSGGFDMRTPTKGAASTVSLFPQGHLLTVPGVGHSTVTADPSGCAANAVHSWMTGTAVPSACPKTSPLVLPVASFPAPGKAHPKRPLSPRATAAAARLTFQDAKAVWLMTAGVSGGSSQAPGVFGGKIVATGRSFRLVGYSDARGVTLSGSVTLKSVEPPIAFQGTLKVGW